MTWDMLLKALTIFLSSSVGTWGFALILHVPKRAWIPASVMGGVAYVVYWALYTGGVMSDPAANFVGALVGAVLAHYCARRMRMIATVFLMLSIIPLVPSLGLYRCMHYLAQSMYMEGAREGVNAMMVIVMIALGLGVGNYVFRIADTIRRHRQGGHAK